MAAPLRAGSGSAGSQQVIYGHGIYDGRFNLDPVNDSNGITRAYAFATMHRNPKDML